jgi:hypothetical protein
MPKPRIVTPEIKAALDDVEAAYTATRRLQERLEAQHKLNGHVVRTAKERGATWNLIGEAAGLSDVGAMKAGNRRE